MRVFARVLHIISRCCAVCAVLAGLVAGLLEAIIAPTFMCVDSCSSPEFWFSSLGPDAVGLLTPCVAFETLALVTFLAYCAITRQARRAFDSLLAFVVVGIIAVAALSALLLQGQDYFVGRFDYFEQGSGGPWLQHWGLALMLSAGVWSGLLARLQWGREAQRTPARML